MNEDFDPEVCLRDVEELYKTACSDQKAAKTVRQIKSQLSSYIKHLEYLVQKNSGNLK